MTQLGTVQVDELVREIARALVDEPNSVEVEAVSPGRKYGSQSPRGAAGRGQSDRQSKGARLARCAPFWRVSMNCATATRSTFWKRTTRSRVYRSIHPGLVSTCGRHRAWAGGNCAGSG